MPRGIPNKPAAPADEVVELVAPLTVETSVEGSDAEVTSDAASETKFYELEDDGRLGTQLQDQEVYARLEVEIQSLLAEAEPLGDETLDNEVAQSVLADIIDQINVLRAKQAKLV